MPFCPDCKALVRPRDGVPTCAKCGWTAAAPAESRVLESKATGGDRVVIEQEADHRPQQDIQCPKCGHEKAYFHLMQTRRSDEPPTQINECVQCSHSWREY